MGYSEVNFYKASVNPEFGSTGLAGMTSQRKMFCCHTAVEPNGILVWHGGSTKSELGVILHVTVV